MNCSKAHDESISTISEISSATSGAGATQDLERSITPNRGNESVIDCETIEDYLKFPDPQKYLVGFIFGVYQTPQ
jgi:hypothetical protein